MMILVKQNFYVSGSLFCSEAHRFSIRKVGLFRIPIPRNKLYRIETGVVYRVPVMHLSFVSMANMGPGNSGYFNFYQCEALQCGAIFIVKTLPKPLLKSWQVNVKIPHGIQTWNQNPSNYSWHFRDDAAGRTWHLSSTVSTLSPSS